MALELPLDVSGESLPLHPAFSAMFLKHVPSPSLPPQQSLRGPRGPELALVSVRVSVQMPPNRGSPRPTTAPASPSASPWLHDVVWSVYLAVASCVSVPPEGQSGEDGDLGLPLHWTCWWTSEHLAVVTGYPPRAVPW